MKLPTFKHEDKRRLLIEFVQDMPIRNCKVLYVKDNTMPLGSHYHKLKDDVFLLAKGFGTYIIDGKREIFNEGDCISVQAGQKHEFDLMKGSILIECSTTPYDRSDEYTV